MSPNDPATTRTYAVRLSPRANQQLTTLPPPISAQVQERLNQLAQRNAEKQVSRVVQGNIVARAYRVLYEVDHDEGTVIVLDVAQRA